MSAEHWLTYTQSLVATLALLFIATLFTLLSVRRKLQLRDSELSRMLVLLATHDDVSDVASAGAVAALEKRLERVDEALAGLGRSQLLIGQSAASADLDDAVSMAQRGVSASAIAERCAIASAEAQLLVRLHANYDAEPTVEALQ
ncbi:MAG: DUF2802 domain-containing protein [Pseudomonadota bacterium]